MATGAERVKMDEAAAELRRHMGPAVAWVQEQRDSVFGDWTLSDAERAVMKNIDTEAGRAQEWLTTWRSWAERGTTPAGESYPVAFWLRVGQDLAGAFAFHMKQQVRAGAFVLGQAVAATVEDLGGGLVAAGEGAVSVLDGVKDVADAIARPWSTGTKLALGAGGLGLAALLIHLLAGKVPDFSTLTGPREAHS